MPGELTRAHLEAKRRLIVATKRAVERTWGDLPAYNRTELDLWLSQVEPIVSAAQRQAAVLADAYVAGLMGRQPFGVSAVRVSGAAVRGGVPLAEVYERPFVQVWSDLRDGKLWEDAVRGGMERAVSAAATDVQLASTHAFAAIGEDDENIFGWQRVPDASACDLCLIASTQRYHSGDLMPIHASCNCSVEPLLEPSGQIINRSRYEDLKGSGRIDSIYRQRQAGMFEKRADANEARAADWLSRAESNPARAEEYRSRADSWNARAADQRMRAEGVRAANRAADDARAGVAYHSEVGPVLVNPDHNFSLPN